jgi:hypothetical protein
MGNPRIALWQKHTLPKERRRRAYRALGLASAVLLILILCAISYRGKWWPSLLDWAVVTLPAILGLVAWVIPVKQTTSFHRVWLFCGGLALSGLIYLQQWETRQEHAKEMGQLPVAIAKELGKMDIFTARTQPVSVAGEVPPPKKNGTAPVPVKPQISSPLVPSGETEKLEDGIKELKTLIVGQRWGLNADQLVTFSRRMAPFAPTVNAWQGGGDIITAVLGNPDSTKFAMNLVAALRSAGWNLPGSGYSQAIFSGNPTGVILQIHSQADADTPALNQLIATLREDGIVPHGEILEGVPPGQFKILIGARPE